MQNREILWLDPVFKQMIWGGEKLRTKWGYPNLGAQTGECWGISAHENGDCTVKEGVYAGKKLSQVWTEHQELFGDVAAKNQLDRFPLLIKIIDAQSDLSIQVHPDDTYANANENGSLGKTECWYILDAPEGATLVIGHHAKDRAELEQMVTEGHWKELLREVPVKKGDFIQIEPGTVHAIKGGIEILETQQNSDITYRVYDYDRLSNGKPRELHIEKSLDVITVPAKPIEESVMETGAGQVNEMQLLIECPYYKVWKLSVDGTANFTQDEPFMNVSVTEGDGSINGHDLHKGDHFILPSGYGKVEITGNLEMILSSL